MPDALDASVNARRRTSRRAGRSVGVVLCGRQPGYLRDTRYDGDPWAYAEIACSGRIFLDARGVRCEKALLVKVALAEESFPTAVERECAREDLAMRYGVPTELSDTAPAWLIDNAREQGPPPDSDDIDLAALIETLNSNGPRC